MIYEKVCRLCLEQDMTISALEKRLNLGNATIRGWKESEPRVGTLKLVADFFGVSVDSFFEDEISDAPCAEESEDHAEDEKREEG